MTHYYEGFPQSDRDEKIKMVNVDELEERVKKVMPEGAYYYIASGAENEWTWRNNTAAFNHFQIVPRALTEMADPQTDTDFMGMHLKTPIMIAPIACHGIAHKDAEVATQKGAAMAGALFSSSTYANKSVLMLWYQVIVKQTCGLTLLILYHWTSLSVTLVQKVKVKA